jgi:hypothetical protein
MPSSTTSTVDPNSPEALASAKAQAAAIPEEKLLPVRVDITEAAFGVMGSMPAIETKRESILAIFGDEGRETLDAVLPAVNLVLEANAEHSAATDPGLDAEAKSLFEKRFFLLAIVNAAIARGVCDGRILSKLMGGTSYVALAHDIMVLVRFITGVLPKLGDVKLTAEQLRTMQLEAQTFGGKVGQRDRARANASVTGMERARAYTYFVRTYDRARKLINFVRWHFGDAEQIAPSIFAGRARKAGPNAGDDEVEPTTPTPVIATPVAPVIAAPVAPVIPAPVVAGPATPAEPATPIAPGLPGADPFIRNS